MQRAGRAIASSSASLVPEPTEKALCALQSPLSTIGTVLPLAGAQRSVLQITRGELDPNRRAGQVCRLVISRRPSR